MMDQSCRSCLQGSDILFHVNGCSYSGKAGLIPWRTLCRRVCSGDVRCKMLTFVMESKEGGGVLVSWWCLVVA